MQKPGINPFHSIKLCLCGLGADRVSERPRLKMGTIIGIIL